MSDATWGFIGLGHMGYPMAKNLRAKMPASNTLIILDVNSDAMKRFVEESKAAAKSSGAGADSMKVETAQNAREVAEKSSVLVTCLPSPEVVKTLYHSVLKHGKLPPLEQERLFVDSSTIDLPSSRQLADAVHKTLGGRFVDAPMSGGVVGAHAGTLSFMFGASSQPGGHIERIKSVLLLMGKKTWHMGEQGAGVSSKLANNYILAINNIATAEAMNMGVQWGLDPKLLADLINSSTGHCWPMAVNNPVPGVVDGAPASKGYEPGGSVSIINKDLRLAMAGADASGIALVLAGTAREVYNAVDDVYRGKDLSVVYQWLQDKPSK
ncbi:3-hydroxyisobutyrate dehydrogenase [Coniosporium apollinis CBS 100218]|uniref:3-hydroxyisobutyrate dehydrogenase n=1 Tax=Coniosporium apollinis (strain CBS 100218) TaxID=1168221 RepID=R7YHE9_CONA1|nr:3-hydroxyisobutyrate dehydrogenase [Coniosporium apollinis CBS 100218]EON61056.1 3-hydroxyisobutyrate dehydrogenase [Coniosporium apollinis CBS 100218]